MYNTFLIFIIKNFILQMKKYIILRVQKYCLNIEDVHIERILSSSVFSVNEKVNNVFKINAI